LDSTIRGVGLDKGSTQRRRREAWVYLGTGQNRGTAFLGMGKRTALELGVEGSRLRREDLQDFRDGESTTGGGNQGGRIGTGKPGPAGTSKGRVEDDCPRGIRRKR